MSGGELRQVSLYSEVLCLEEGGAGGSLYSEDTCLEAKGVGWSHVRRGAGLGVPAQ